jgi:predicted metal-dependent hydrolase
MDRVYLVPGSWIKKKILAAVHDLPLAGHQGFFKTYREIIERFSWNGLKQDVMRYIRECVTCQQDKLEHTLPA